MLLGTASQNALNFPMYFTPMVIARPAGAITTKIRT